MEHQTEDIATVVDPVQEGTEAEQPELESPEGEIEEVGEFPVSMRDGRGSALLS